MLSRVEDGYWGGYYEIVDPGQGSRERVSCLCKFVRTGEKIRMVMLSSGITTAVFSVRRNSRDPSFAHLHFDTEDDAVTIEAKQLYLNRRYILERLWVGRFSDFWERNRDDDIRGYVGGGSDARFEVERLNDDRVLNFCNDQVLGRNAFSSRQELEMFLSAALQ